MLVCGIENGLGILYDADTLTYQDHKQLQAFNCAVTQFTRFESSNLVNYLACSGDGRTIEFFDLIQSQANADYNGYTIKKFESFSIIHGEKVNCLRYLNKKLFVADTTNDLTIYNF